MSPTDTAGTASGEPLSRRDRARVETAREIRETARRLLVAHGPGGFALRAIAREMGMTAPALYRYFDSREDLVEHVIADLYGELCDELEAARDAARPAVPAVQLLAASRAFRRWSTGHVPEFGLLFGSAADGRTPGNRPAGTTVEGPAAAAAERFGSVFADLVAGIWLDRRFPVPEGGDIDPALRAQLGVWGGHFRVELPLGVLRVFLSCWVRLYGMVCLEIFGHLRFALSDAEPLFEDELRQLGELLGIADQYTAPGAGEQGHR